ncbi:MAG: hypothetical protein AAGD47_04935 [Pseudomonadota bacterium]
MPATGAIDAPHLFSSTLSEVCSGGGNWTAVRALRRMALAGSRAVFLDAGIGILPAIAAQMGATRVIAFERDRERVWVAQTLLAANRLQAEVIHGHGAMRPAIHSPTFSPAFDLNLILGEERIDTLVVVLGVTEPKLLSSLPASVARVLIAGEIEPDCSPSRDLMISCLIGGGYSFDPKASEGDAMSFCRRGQPESRRAG